jgi:phosphoglycolate phosphatase
MSSYSLVVFDWDGTLMDSTHSIVTAIQGACQDLNLPVPSSKTASWVIGLSLESALHKAVPELTEAQLPEFLNRYRIHYLLRDPDLKLFDGTGELLASLAGLGVKLAVATGASRVGLDRMLLNTGLDRVFDATCCADETFSKPHPAMLLELMEVLDVAAEQTVMVGDTSHDLRMAANVGVDAVAVTYGAHAASELRSYTAIAVVGSVFELRDWLLPRVAVPTHARA